MQVNLGLKGSQKGGNTIRKKRKIIYFSCIGYMYFRWFWTEQGKSYSGSRTFRDRKSPSSEQKSAYSFFFVTETCAGGGIPTLFVSIIARAGHTGVCPGTKAWSCAGNLSESVSSDCLEWYAFITLVTRTLNGNEKQFKLTGSIAKFNLPY